MPIFVAAAHGTRTYAATIYATSASALTASATATPCHADRISDRSPVGMIYRNVQV